MKIEDLDRNMRINGLIERSDLEWRDSKEEPFSIHGLYQPKDKGSFVRMNMDVARNTSEGVFWLATNTAGGRVRFVTDSAFVAIHAEMNQICKMDHMAFTGIFGFDMYIEKPGQAPVYRGSFRPPVDIQDGYESILELPAGGPWDVTINMPLYNPVDRLLIGLQDKCMLDKPRTYRIEKPVVYYGSSITQGGCASRPGNSYQSMISRMLDCDYINLGFSGCGRGEDVIVEYMANLEMSAFVSDYDHNAPSAEHLLATHEKLYRAVRAKHPDIPYIIVSKPDVLWKEEDSAKRLAVIRQTYEHALADGDNKVALIDGSTLFDGLMPDSCTVDGCHPNDLGFTRMAEKIGRELARFL